MGVLIAGAFVVPFVLGLVLDRRVGSGSIFLVAGLLVGTGAAAAVVVTRFRRYL